MTSVKTEVLSTIHKFPNIESYLQNIDVVNIHDLALVPFNPFPVGAIYISALGTNPADLFGGKWQALDEGRVLIGANSKYTAGSKGGEETHTLTSSEMPSHSHRANTGSGGNHYHGSPLAECYRPPVLVAYHGWYDTANNHIGRNGDPNNRQYSYLAYTNTTGAHSHSVYGSIYNAGDNQAHNNMMPYLAVYMWQRIE